MCTSTPERFEVLDSFIRLWRNECLRVFHDRLIDEKDKKAVQLLIRKLVEENFHKDEEFILRDPCLFGDYRNALQVRVARFLDKKSAAEMIDLIEFDS